MCDAWGPLAALAGEWEAAGGLDTAFAHAQGKVIGTPYLEKVAFQPFGPVDNGDQHLYGLDYKTAMWRNDEENPFHTEVGYWLWDGATGEIVRGFVVPRGITVLAGGTADPTPPSSPSGRRRGATSTSSARTGTWRPMPARPPSR